MYWYNIFGYYNIRQTQKTFRPTGDNLSPLISPKLPGAITFSLLLCKSCLLGKGRLTSIQSKNSNPIPEHADLIKMNDLLPGDCVSNDQYECRIKGRSKNTRGKEDPQNIYCGGAIFADHGTSKIDVMYQVSLGASDTARNK